MPLFQDRGEIGVGTHDSLNPQHHISPTTHTPCWPLHPVGHDTQVTKLGMDWDLRTPFGRERETLHKKQAVHTWPWHTERRRLTTQRNASRNNSKIPFSPNLLPTIKKRDKTAAGKEARAKPLSHTKEWSINCTHYLPVSLMCMPIRRFHFKEIAKETKGQRCKDAGILIFRAALFTVTKSWKHPKCPLIKDLHKL